MNEIARPIPPDPLTIRMHERDNVAIVANDSGLPKGTFSPHGGECDARILERSNGYRWPHARLRKCLVGDSVILL